MTELLSDNYCQWDLKVLSSYTGCSSVVTDMSAVELEVSDAFF